MPDDSIMPPRIVIGFRGRQFSIFTDEITEFLINCDDHGIHTLNEITEMLKELAVAAGGNISDKQCELINELSFLFKGAIHEDL